MHVEGAAGTRDWVYIAHNPVLSAVPAPSASPAFHDPVSAGLSCSAMTAPLAPLPGDAHDDLRAEVADQAARLAATEA